MDNVTPVNTPSLRVRLTPPLIALTLLLVYVPGGCRDSWMAKHRARFTRKQEAIAQSPLHAKCALCSKPATHSQDYWRGAANFTFYFCDDHWPAPEKAPSDALEQGKRVDDIGPTLRGDEIASLVPVGVCGLSLAMFLTGRQERRRLKAFNLVAVAFGVVLICWTMARFFGVGVGR